MCALCVDVHACIHVFAHRLLCMHSHLVMAPIYILSVGTNPPHPDAMHTAECVYVPICACLCSSRASAYVYTLMHVIPCKPIRLCAHIHNLNLDKPSLLPFEMSEQPSPSLLDNVIIIASLRRIGTVS